MSKSDLYTKSGELQFHKLSRKKQFGFLHLLFQNLAEQDPRDVNLDLLTHCVLGHSLSEVNVLGLLNISVVRKPGTFIYREGIPGHATEILSSADLGDFLFGGTSDYEEDLLDYGCVLKRKENRKKRELVEYVADLNHKDLGLLRVLTVAHLVNVRKLGKNPSLDFLTSVEQKMLPKLLKRAKMETPITINAEGY